MRQLGLQLGVAALPDITAVVAHGTRQVGIAGPARLGTVVHHQLHSAHLIRIRQCRKEVAVRARQIVLWRQLVLIVVAHILIAQASIHLTDLGQIAAIGGKACIVVFLHLALRVHLGFRRYFVYTVDAIVVGTT